MSRQSIRIAILILLTGALAFLGITNSPWMPEQREKFAGASTGEVMTDSSPGKSPRVQVTPLIQAPCLRGNIRGVGVSPLRVFFVGAKFPAANVGNVVSSSISISPSVTGQWRWTNPDELTFYPETDWIDHLKYMVVFSRNLFPEQTIIQATGKDCAGIINPAQKGISDNTLGFCFTPRYGCFESTGVPQLFSFIEPKVPNVVTDIPDPFVLIFANAVARESDVNMELKSGVSITPHLNGTWVWTSRSMLSLKPSEAWKPNTRYTVKLTDSVFDPDAIIPGYEYTFSTPQRIVEVHRKDVSISPPGELPVENNPKPSPLHLFFRSNVAGPSLIGKELLAGPDLTPKIAGRWEWASGSNLTFTPDAHWPASVNYRLTLNGATFGDVPDSHSSTFNFQTSPIKVILEQPQLYTDPANAKVKRIIATIRFSHPMNRTELERSISLVVYANPASTHAPNSPSQQLGFKVTYDQFDRVAYITSEPVRIPEIDSEALIRIGGGLHSTLSLSDAQTNSSLPQQAKVYVPGMANFFKISDVSFQQVLTKKHDEDQIIVITSTTGLAPMDKESISAYQLPEFFPGTEGNKDRESYDWSNSAEVTPQILSVSSPVALEPIPSEVSYSTMASFRFRALSNRYLFVSIKEGLKSVEGYTLTRPFEQTVFIGQPRKTIKIMAKGSLLSLSGEKKLSVLVRSVSKMEIEISRVLPATLNALVSQTSGDFQSPYFTSYTYSADDIAERFTELREFPVDDHGKVQYTAIDFGGLLNSKMKTPRGLFLLRMTETKQAGSNTPSPSSSQYCSDEEGCEEGYNYNAHDTAIAKESRLVLVTDLGIVVKQNQSGTQDVFVQNLASGLPTSGATVQVLGRNGLAVFRQTTDANGHVSLPSLQGLNREKEPIAYTAELNGDLTFMPYSRQDRRLNLSRFDIGGLQTVADAPGIQSFLFTDRQVYRPGDEMHFGLVTKPDDWKQDIVGMPLEAVLIDPRGAEIRKEKLKLSTYGFDELAHSTTETSPTGNYELALYVVKDDKRSSRLGSTTARVEEFLPDRMRVKVSLSEVGRPGWISPENLAADVSLQNLFGTPAQDRKVKAHLQLQPTGFSFPGFRDYSFFDPYRAKSTFDEELADQTSDKAGKVHFELALERFSKATYRLNILASGYEMEGGRSVSAVTSAIVSPLKSLVGFSPTCDGGFCDLNYIPKGAQAQVSLVAIDPDLQPITVGALKAILAELRWISVLTKQANGSFAYQSVLKEIPVSSSPLDIVASRTILPLETSRPGNFALLIQDADGLELNRIRYSVFGAGDLSVNLEANAELDVKLDRKEYSQGDDIAISIRAPYAGAGLITIEKDKVYSYTWFKSETRSSVQHIKVPQDLEGNGYINVTFVRALNSKDIYLTPLSYAVAPFSVDRERHRSKLELDAPTEIKPGNDLVVRYKGTNGKATIYLVDEGILQFARYQTPDPLAYFFRKRALEVSTAQILDLLLPEYSLERELSVTGGDDDLMRKHLNPFKRKRAAPVVAWSGIVDLTQDQQEFAYKVPEYFNGAIRVMAVAVAADGVASAERSTTVRGSFVISPNVPAAVSPGDKFEVTASVSNGLPTAAEVGVSLLAGANTNGTSINQPGIKILGDARVTKTIQPGDETSIVFHAEAQSVLGASTLRFEASETKEGGAHAGITEEVSIRPPSPLRATMQAGMADLSTQNTSVTVPIARRDVYPLAAKLDGTVSALPFGFTSGFKKYLDGYPYGCTEQLTSMAIGLFVMLDYPTFGNADRKKVEQKVNIIIRTLRSRQGHDGALALWSPGGYVSNTAHLYAVLMLMEAKDREFAIPSDMLKDALRYTEELSNVTPPDPYNAAFASYLVARSGKVAMRSLTTLRSWLDSQPQNGRLWGNQQGNQQGWQRSQPGLFLAATYKLLKADKEALALFNNISAVKPVRANYDYYYDSFVHGSIYFYLAAKHFPDSQQKLSPSAIKNYLLPAMTANNFSTHSASWAILALDAYMRSVTSDSQSRYWLEVTDQADVTTPVLLNDARFPSFALPLTAKSLRFNGQLPLYYQLYQEGYDKELQTTAISNHLEVDRRIIDEAGNAITGLTFGQKAVVVIRIRGNKEEPIPNVVVVDMLPGGFEVEMSKNRFNQSNQGTFNDWGFGILGSTFSPDYADVREDRVLLFGTVSSRQHVEFRYRLNPTNRGTFIVPPVYAESMYDRSVNALAPGGVITVKEE